MKARYRKSGYKKEEIDRVWKDNILINTGLADLSWRYIKSISTDKLEANRQLLIDALRPEDKRYIKDIWQSKEKRVVWYYTKFYLNLGSTASQRGESYHSVMREITNGQLSIE
jgi:hypothetical protein